MAVGAVMGAGAPAAAIAAAAWVSAAIAFGLCDRQWWTQPRLLYTAVAKAWAASSLVCWVASLLVVVAPQRILALPLAALVVAVTVRAAWRAAALRRPKRVVIVDAVGEKRLAPWLAYYWPEWQVVGLLDDHDRRAAERLAAAHGATTAYYLNGRSSLPAGRLRVLSLDDLLERVSGRILVDHAEGVTLRCGRMSQELKRATDICVAAAGLVALSPLLALLAALIKLESRGPVIYRQRRLGRDLRPFDMLKFRSMVEHAEEDTGPVWAEPNDSRCTALGRVLRRLHLDELPQLVNVLRGEMSLVGPRPERPELADDLLQTMSAYRTRLAVKPGVTGWAQVNQGYDRGIEDVCRKLEYDLFYVKHHGPLFDAAILLRTIDAVVFGQPSRPARPDPPQANT